MLFKQCNFTTTTNEKWGPLLERLSFQQFKLSTKSKSLLGIMFYLLAFAPKTGQYMTIYNSDKIASGQCRGPGLARPRPKQVN